MKKGLSLLCLLAMLLSLVTAMTVGTAAVAPSTLPDTIAKYRTAVYTETKPTIDGKKDAAYEKATPFYVNKAFRAKVWTLWNADGLYFYAEARKVKENETAGITSLGFFISGIQYTFDGTGWWTNNKDGSEFRGNYRFHITRTDADNASTPPGSGMKCVTPEGFEKKVIKHYLEDNTTEQGFDLEVFVPMKKNDWDISKGAGQSYIGLGMYAHKDLSYCSGYKWKTEYSTWKEILSPSALEPLRLIADPTTCKHEKVTYTSVSTTPTLIATGVEAGTCQACGTAVTQALPANAIQMRGVQTRQVGGGYDVRFVSQIAALENLSEVGYEITLSYGKTKDTLTEGKTQIWKTDTVYTSIQAGDKTETPNQGGNYLVAVPVRDIPISEDVKFVKFDVIPFTVSLTGETVYAAGAGASYVIESGTVIDVQTKTAVPQTIIDPVTGKTLTLKWYDEFNGSTLDESKWKLENRMKSANSKVATTVDRKNIRLENGKAVMNLYQDGDKYYSHRTLTTMDRMSFKYGYLEIYAKVPFSQGSWPSFWLQSAKSHRTKSDIMTEVDVFEVYRSGRVEGTLHKWKLDDKDQSTHECWNDPIEYAFPEEEWENLSNEYHRWGFGWTKEQIYLTVDGKVFATFDITDKGDFCQGKGKGTLTGMDCFQDPLFINFTNWIGTGFRDTNWAVNENTVFPKTFSVAWVRLYQGEGGELYNDFK